MVISYIIKASVLLFLISSVIAAIDKTGLTYSNACESLSLTSAGVKAFTLPALSYCTIKPTDPTFNYEFSTVANPNVEMECGYPS